MRSSFCVRPSVPLTGGFDAEQRFAAFPRNYTIKGLFFPRLVEMLGDGFSALVPSLAAPPRGGRYLSFSDYPQADYSRVVWAVARRSFSGISAREASRRVAWRDMETYSASRVGSVTLSLLGDPASTLSQLPRMMALVLKGGELSSRRLGEREVELTYRRFFGWVDCYAIGTLEGIVQHYDCTPEIEATLVSETEATYRVRWS
ncbi:MAG: DUF2378 family protein [Polyangiales bacterium]